MFCVLNRFGFNGYKRLNFVDIFLKMFNNKSSNRKFATRIEQPRSGTRARSEPTSRSQGVDSRLSELASFCPVIHPAQRRKAQNFHPGRHVFCAGLLFERRNDVEL